MKKSIATIAASLVMITGLAPMAYAGPGNSDFGHSRQEAAHERRDARHEERRTQQEEPSTPDTRAHPKGPPPRTPPALPKSRPPRTPPALPKSRLPRTPRAHPVSRALLLAQVAPPATPRFKTDDSHQRPPPQHHR